MRLRKLGFVLICFALILLFGCGKGKTEKQPEEAETKEQDVVEEISEPVTPQRKPGAEPEAEESVDWFERFKAKISGEPDAEPRPLETPAKSADPDTLKALLPVTLGGMQRSAVSAARTPVMGVELSHAAATYRGNGAEIRIEITDLRAAAGSSMMAETHPWTTQDINRENQARYERTTTFSEYRAFESYDNNANRGTLAVLVGNHVVVEATGSDVAMDSMKSVLGGMDLQNLEAMK